MKKSSMLLLVLCLSAAMNSRPVAAYDEWIGGQVCQPMNLEVALQGLAWRSEGVLNMRDKSLWVVCPVGHGLFYDLISVIVSLTNSGDSGATIQCLWKVTDLAGRTVRSRNKSVLVGPGTTDTMSVDDLIVGGEFPEAISVSCNLPPDTGILFIGSISY